MKLLIDDNNKWSYTKSPKSINPVLKDSLIKYLNLLSTVFEQAKKISEFEFIFTLLRIREMQGPGWDPYETSAEVFSLISKMIDKAKDYKTHRHLSLWLYGHIVEASELYEILTCFLKICDGGRFCSNNFPDKKRGKYYYPISPSEKIDKIYDLAKRVNLQDNILPLKEVYHRELRNAIFHSDYCLFNGELRLTKQNLTIENIQFTEIINKGFAYFMAMSNLIKYYISSYSEPKIIKVHPGFSPDPNETAITIIRKEHGLVGIKDHTKSKSGDEYVSYRLGRFYEGESELLDGNRTLSILPASKIDKINKLLKFVPMIIRKHLIKFLKNKI